MTSRIPSSGVATAFALAAITLEATASVMYSAAAGFASGLSVEPSKLLAAGPTSASLIHWGSLIDMLGYLCILPVVFYLRQRYPAAGYGNLLAAAGAALVVIGSIGAAAMATAAPPLMTSYVTASSAEKQALIPAFSTLYRVVVPGLWQTLETIPAAVWLLGTAAAARRNGPRITFFTLLVLGLITGAIALYRLSVPA